MAKGLAPQKTGFAQSVEQSGASPFFETIVHRRTRAHAGGVEGAPLAAETQHKQYRLEDKTIVLGLSAAAPGMRIAPGRQERRDLRP